MAGFEEKLDQLLSDPEAMSQIAALAGKLNGQPASPPPEEEPLPGETAPPLLGPDQMAQAGRLLSLLQSSGQPDKQSAALLQALRPFLRPERQQKLDRAMRLAGLSHAARQVYQMWKEGELSV